MRVFDFLICVIIIFHSVPQDWTLAYLMALLCAERHIKQNLLLTSLQHLCEELVYVQGLCVAV